MLEYEWGNPSTIMLSGEEPTQEPDQNRQIFDHYTVNDHQSFHDNLVPQPAATALFHQHHPSTQHQVNTLFDPRAFAPNSAAAAAAVSPYAAAAHHTSLLSLDHVSPTGHGGGSPYFLIPKAEEVSRSAEFTARIGLNLGGRTYFSSAEDDFVNRLYRRTRPLDGGGGGMATNAPRCQAEGCNADLTHAKHYHRRHKVCEFHSKASTVIAAGLTQRFCQQCSRNAIEKCEEPMITRSNPEGICVRKAFSVYRFHVLSEFDNGKRSCRKRLADHNRRRRKSHQTSTQDQKSPADNARDSSSDNLCTRSPQDSGAHSSSSVTVAVSPPRMSLDCFKQRPYHATASSSSSVSSGSLFFLSG